MSRTLVVVASAVMAAIALLLVVAIYLLYVERPPLPAAPVTSATLEVGGRSRHYAVFTPTALRQGASAILVFHPSQSSGTDMRRMIGGVLERMAERDNVVLVYPDGYEGHFNDCRREASYSARRLDVDDVGFVRRIVAGLVEQHRVDPQRVYALGYSNGGHMALRLALEDPDLVRGVVAIAANLPAADNLDCRLAPSPARFIGFIEGTRDPINPYGGGRVTLFGLGNRGKVLSAEDSAEWFAAALELSPAGERIIGRAGGLSAREQDWTSATGHVRLLTIEGGGHTLPQSGHRSQRILGPTFQGDAVLESAWQLLVGSPP
jgi:polyhydroxybutyrate depolymerase